MDNVKNGMSTLRKLWLFYLLICVLNSYLGWQCFEQIDLYTSDFFWLAWLTNDLSAILYVLIFFQIFDQMNLKISRKHVVFGLLIVITPCISYRFLISSNVAISTILIFLFPISIIGIEYLLSLTNLIQFRGPDEYKIQKAELLGSLALMRTIFSLIILFFVFKEGIPEGLVNPLVLIVLAVKCIYIVRIGFVSSRM